MTALIAAALLIVFDDGTPAPEPMAAPQAAGSSELRTRTAPSGEEDDPLPPGAAYGSEARLREGIDRRAEEPMRGRAGEASVDELRRAAVRRLLIEPERARSYLRRARAAGWLPEMRVRIERRFGRDESLTPRADVPPMVGLDTNNDALYEWRATWDLSRLVFNPDELNAQQAALRLGEARREIERLVIRLYFERHRLLEPRTAGGAGSARRLSEREHREDLDRAMRVAEIEAELDALTDGALFPRRGTAESR